VYEFVWANQDALLCPASNDIPLSFVPDILKIVEGESVDAVPQMQTPIPTTDTVS
jgi:hypothetical protein